MQLMSSSFTPGGMIPVRFTCDGENVSPEFSWKRAPPGTKSFALIIHDPDAPRGFRQARQFFAFLCTIPNTDNSDWSDDLGQLNHSTNCFVIECSNESCSESLIDAGEHEKHCCERAIHNAVEFFAASTVAWFGASSIRDDHDAQWRLRQITLPQGRVREALLCVVDFG
jgi:hypothetical protein